MPAGEGKRIEVGDPVEVSPVTVSREEHGFIRGRVVAISELPATKLTLEEALGNPEMADAYLKRYALEGSLRIRVKLEELNPSDVAALGGAGSKDRNRFRWSSSSGPAQPLKTGTVCQAAIVVKKQRLITLIVPWIRRM